MYTNLENGEHLRTVEASAKYHNRCVLMKLDSKWAQEGVVMCVGDDYDELLNVQMSTDASLFYLVVEGDDLVDDLGGGLLFD
jgi:hypothetical protein